MRADHRAVEHLHQVRRAAEPRQHGEEILEHACLAEPVEPLPHAVPVAVTLGQRAPGDVVDREIMQRFEEHAVVPSLRAAGRQAGPEHLHRESPIRLGHLRGHRRPSLLVGIP